MLKISSEYNNNTSAIEKEARKLNCFKYQDNHSILVNQTNPFQQNDQANDRLQQQIRTPGSARERAILNALGAGLDNNHSIDRSAADVTAIKPLYKNEFDNLRNGNSSKAGQNHADQAAGSAVGRHQQIRGWQSSEHLKDFEIQAQYVDEQYQMAQ